MLNLRKGSTAVKAVHRLSTQAANMTLQDSCEVNEQKLHIGNTLDLSGVVHLKRGVFPNSAPPAAARSFHFRRLQDILYSCFLLLLSSWGLWSNICLGVFAFARWQMVGFPCTGILRRFIFCCVLQCICYSCLPALCWRTLLSIRAGLVI